METLTHVAGMLALDAYSGWNPDWRNRVMQHYRINFLALAFAESRLARFCLLSRLKPSKTVQSVNMFFQKTSSMLCRQTSRDRDLVT